MKPVALIVRCLLTVVSVVTRQFGSLSIYLFMPKLIMSRAHWNNVIVQRNYQSVGIGHLLLSLYDHTILLTRLSSCFGFQFRGSLSSTGFFIVPLVTLLPSFRVKCGSTLSSSQTSSYGVPQGSVLDPLLFIMYSVHHSSARNLGFIFDEYLSFSDQISGLSKSCYCQCQ